MIEERKELHNIKCQYASFKYFGPTSLNQVCYKYTSILSRLLDYIVKLVEIKNAILDNIQLKSPNNYLLNKLTKCHILCDICLFYSLLVLITLYSNHLST